MSEKIINIPKNMMLVPRPQTLGFRIHFSMILNTKMSGLPPNVRSVLYQLSMIDCIIHSNDTKDQVLQRIRDALATRLASEYVNTQIFRYWKKDKIAVFDAFQEVYCGDHFPYVPIQLQSRDTPATIQPYLLMSYGKEPADINIPHTTIDPFLQTYDRAFVGFGQRSKINKFRKEYEEARKREYSSGQGGKLVVNSDVKVIFAPTSMAENGPEGPVPEEWL